MPDLPLGFVKEPHRPGCDGQMYRDRWSTKDAMVFTDRIGRIGNGGNVTLDYRCNQKYLGCNARFLLTESAMLGIVHDMMPLPAPFPEDDD